MFWLNFILGLIFFNKHYHNHKNKGNKILTNNEIETKHLHFHVI